jgi:hypothetical protein
VWGNYGLLRFKSCTHNISIDSSLQLEFNVGSSIKRELSGDQWVTEIGIHRKSQVSLREQQPQRHV